MYADGVSRLHFCNSLSLWIFIANWYFLRKNRFDIIRKGDGIFLLEKIVILCFVKKTLQNSIKSA